MVSLPVTAGTHTVTWKYEKDSSRNVGSDAAWIDSVSLPIQATALSACTALTPALSNITPGSAKALTATCNNAPSPTGYVWKAQKAGVATPTVLACTGSNCTVAASPAAAGTYTITVTNNNASGTGTVAASATITVSANPKSDCTVITPPLSNIPLGTGKALLASCNNAPAPTGYVWKVQKTGAATPTTLTCTGASCTVPAAILPTIGNYTVTVSNNNAGGAGNVAGRATITVSTTPKSDCIATPVLSNVALGTGKALVASCNNAPAPTGYVWKVQKTGAATPTTLACTGASCTVPAASLPTIGNYTVTVSNNNAGGAGNVAGRATITVSTTPKSDCIAVTPATASLLLGSASPLLTATCTSSPAATGYVWKVQQSGVATPTVLSSCTGASCTVPAGNLTTAGTYAVTVTNNNANGTGNVAARSTLTVLTQVDTTPNPFVFTAQTGVPVSTEVTSNTITVSGINSPAPISIFPLSDPSTPIDYSINGGPFTHVNGTVTNGQTVTVRLTSSPTNAVVSRATLTIGGVSGIFSVTTASAPGWPITWIPHVSNTTSQLNHVIFAGGQFVAVGKAGAIVTSPDGVNWTPRNSGTVSNIGILAYGNGRYVAISDTGVLTSSNGISWTHTNWWLHGPGTSISSIAFGNGYFVMVGYAFMGSGVNKILRSIDGLDWTDCGNGEDQWRDVTFANNLFVAVGGSGHISTSSNGLTWTLRQAAGDELWGVAYGSAGFLAAGMDSAVYASTSGGTWSLIYRDGGDTLYIHTFGAGYYILTGQPGGSYVTRDGVNFLDAGLPLGRLWNGIAYGNGKFVAVGKDGQIVSGIL